MPPAAARPSKINGRASVQFMGDWVKGEFALAKQTAGKDSSCIAGFGANSSYIIQGAVLDFPMTTQPDAVKRDGLLRTIFLYPYVMTFVATGLVWQWVLNPTDAIQQAVRRLGFPDFVFDWIIDQDKVIDTVVIASG